VGGLNYANNLLLGLCFFLGSLIVVTIHHTYANLSGLRITAVGTTPAYAGEKAGFHLRLDGSTGRTHQSLQLFWGEAEVQLDRVNTPQEVGLYLTAPRRGLFHPPRLKIITYYPLGLLNAWTWLDLDLSALVYPRPLPSSEVPTGPGQEGEGEVERIRGTEDFDGLRQYTPGDSQARISWRHAARGQGLLTKLYADELAGTEMLDWNHFSGMDREKRLSHLTWWVAKFAAEDRSYGLRLPGVEIAVDRGPQHRDACLEALAMFEWKP
jgi:uncharacterized protein (DUF58 family)